MPKTSTQRLLVVGQVQGVGFRPYVFRLANGLGLSGSVANRSTGVEILIQGEPAKQTALARRLEQDAPGKIESILTDEFEGPVFTDFRIAHSSDNEGLAQALLADRGICGQCRAEFDDARNHRYLYPFISCTHCGPRFSVTHRLPYDRENTSWRNFPPCRRCAEEYENPKDRRFHMVGISCPDCGPSFYSTRHRDEEQSIAAALQVLSRGGVLAVKGSAGFQLMVDATNAEAVEVLRARKQRTKPFAVLATSLDWLTANAQVDAIEREALESEIAPIVLLHSHSEVAQSVAPGTGLLAAMLPNSGIQLRLLNGLNRPLVATSGNLAEEPLLFRNREAEASLSPVSDYMLLHDLELTQGLDDSIQRVMNSRPVNLRLGRGLAPMPINFPGQHELLGCSAHLKTNISVMADDRLVVGPHIGNLDSHATRLRYREQKHSLPEFFRAPALQEVTDAHPDYGSTIEADYRARCVQHHVAHAMSVWLEHRVQPPFLALAWDGIGLGPDATIWGGEWLLFDDAFRWQRVASITPFTLPRRPDISRFPGLVADALAGGEPTGNGIACTSMGRLIEGMAVLAGLQSVNQYEAQVAMKFEALARQADSPAPMEFDTQSGNLDWRPLLPIMQDHQLDLATRALGFHQALAKAAARLCALHGTKTRLALLSGGVFQNQLLLELLTGELQALHMQALTHRQIPPNDGGISAGQCVATACGVRPLNEGIVQCA